MNKKKRNWEDRCFIVALLGGTAHGSRLNIFFCGKIYETQQGCYKKMKADWLRVNNERLTTHADNAGQPINQ
jgi:hypothetical protein